MEAAGLRHLPGLQILVCIEHRRGVTPTGVSNHLRNSHRLKGERLSAALEELEVLRPQLLPPSQLADVPHHTLYVPEIESCPAFHCQLPNCNEERAALSVSRRTVEKHQAKVHGVNDERRRGGRTSHGSSGQYYDIAAVRIQSLLPRPYEKPFIIKELVTAVPPLESPALPQAPTSATLATLACFDADIEAATKEDERLYDRVPREATVAQLPPWLTQTGISSHLGGMEKETIHQLAGPPSASTYLLYSLSLDLLCLVICLASRSFLANPYLSLPIAEPHFHLIEDAIVKKLFAIRRETTVGRRGSRLSRYSARLLNTFESGREHTKQFYNVQNDETLRRYGRSWSQMIACLIRMHNPAEFQVSCQLPSLGERELDQLAHVIVRSEQALEARTEADEEASNNQSAASPSPSHTASGVNSSDNDNFNTGDDDDSHGTDGDAAGNGDLDNDANVGSSGTVVVRRERPSATKRTMKRLISAVTALSISLVRSRYAESAYKSPIVGYAAFRALSNQGGWLHANQFTGVLSGLIHCSQLWLACHCLSLHPPQTAQDAEAIHTTFKTECGLYLVNNTPSPVSELSYWRLIAGVKTNDTVRPPATVINDDATAITHRETTMDIQAWRDCLQTLVTESTELLDDTLLLGLTSAPRYPLSLLQDDVSDSRQGHSFLTCTRNGLQPVDNWLAKQVRENSDLTRQFVVVEEPLSAGRATPDLEDRNVATPSSPPQAFSPSSPPPPPPPRSTQYRQSAINVYLHANQEFLQRLAVLIHMGSGLPARQRELVEITWRNEEGPRNLYITHNRVVLITGYHKSQRAVGTKPIARFLAPAVAELLVRYLIYVTPFVRFLSRCIALPPPRGNLFSDVKNQLWNGEMMRDCLRRQTQRVLGIPLLFLRYRHMAIAMDRRLLQGVGCRAYGIRQDWHSWRPTEAEDNTDNDQDDS